MQSNSFSNLLYKYISTYTFYCVYLPLIIYWITLFALTTVPVDVVPQLFNYQDKIEHFVAYGVLAFLLTLALFFQKRSRLISSKAFLFTFIFIFAYGAIDEIHQLFVPGRFCDLYDWFADAIGGSLGVGLVYLFLKSHLRTRDKAVNL